MRLHGIDEAGYGPLLGPLVIGAVEFEGRQGEPLRRPRKGPGAWPLGDSKQLLSRRRGLARLEAVVLGFHAAAYGAAPPRLLDWLALDPRAADSLARLPWYGGLDDPLPFFATTEELRDATRAVKAGEVLAGARPIGLALRVIGEAELNESWDVSGNKHESLFDEVLRLVEGSATHPGAHRFHIDKLGGRSHYGEKLSLHFPFVPLETLGQSRDESRYRLSTTETTLELAFIKKADAIHPEVGLASMLAKYTRELLMSLFNRFWSVRQPEVARTAGYYADGHRFLDDLRAAGALDSEIERALVRRR